MTNNLPVTSPSLDLNVFQKVAPACCQLRYIFVLDASYIINKSKVMFLGDDFMLINFKLFSWLGFVRALTNFLT